MSKRVQAAPPKFARAIQIAIKKRPDVILSNVERLFEAASSYDSIEDMKEWVADTVGNKRNWQVYTSQGETYIVTSVKGEGVPDYDDVMGLVAEKAGVEADAVKSGMTAEAFDQHFWDTVHAEIDEWDLGGGTMSVVGREGGYWGVEWSNDFLELDANAVKKAVKALTKDRAALSSISRRIERSDDPHSADAALHAIADYVNDEWDLTSFVNINSDVSKLFASLDKKISTSIEAFAQTDRWVKDIVANQCWAEQGEATADETAATLDLAAEHAEESGDSKLAAEIDKVVAEISNPPNERGIHAVLDEVAEDLDDHNPALATRVDEVAQGLPEDIGSLNIELDEGDLEQILNP